MRSQMKRDRVSPNVIDSCMALCVDCRGGNRGQVQLRPRACHRAPGLSLHTLNVNVEANVAQAKYGYSNTAARTLMRLKATTVATMRHHRTNTSAKARAP